jgi:hypothetical protein
VFTGPLPTRGDLCRTLHKRGVLENFHPKIR